MGREIIYTDYSEINMENLIEVIDKAKAIHEINATKCKDLLDYCDGAQERIREKLTRTDIDNWTVDDLCGYIAEFKLGFEWGNPITLVQANDSDLEADTLTKAVTQLNKMYRVEGISKKTQELARNVEVCGVGYTFEDINVDYRKGKSCFTHTVLSPMTTFVVRSRAFVDKRIVLGVTFSKLKDGTEYLTAFTKDRRYELQRKDGKYSYRDRNDEMNPIGMIPIVEWIRDFDRQGCFEKLMSLQNGVNLGVSDFLNDVDQNTNAVWHGNDIEFKTRKVKTEDENGNMVEVDEPVTPHSREWVLTETTQDGRTPSIKPLTLPYDYTGMLSHIASMRSEMLKLAHVPERNDNSGGSTGVAMSDAAGWTDAEGEACRKEMIMASQKMEEVEVILAIINVSPHIEQSSPLLELTVGDLIPNFKRSKTYDLTSKVNAICTMIAHGFNIEDAVGNVPLFEDPAQVILNSREGVEKYQEKNFGEDNEDTNPTKSSSDLSYQVENSPTLQ